MLATEYNEEIAILNLKIEALAELKERRASKPEQINNSCLYAGSSMYFYCTACGHLSDVLPECYMVIPKKLCDNCAPLQELDWFE